MACFSEKDGDKCTKASGSLTRESPMVLLVPTIRVSVCISPLVSVAHDSDVCPLARYVPSDAHHVRAFARRGVSSWRDWVSKVLA